MDYFCDVCNEKNKITSKSRYLKSLTHNEIENIYV